MSFHYVKTRAQLTYAFYGCENVEKTLLVVIYPYLKDS